MSHLIKDNFDDERILNNAAYRRLIPMLIKDNEGEWIVISKGELIDIFDNRLDAIRVIKTNDLLDQCNLVSPITTKKRKGVLGFGRKLK
jgi:hypothetical protein